MRCLNRFAALCAVAMLATSCSDAPTGSDTAVAALGRIGLAPVFSPTAVQAYKELSAFGVEVTSVHVRLVAPDGSTRDTSIAFPVGMSELEMELSVPLRTAGTTFRADLELLNSDGVVLFSGSQQVVAQVWSRLSRITPATIHISYTGPGATAKTLTVSPATGVIAGSASIPVSVTGKDASGGLLSNLLVRWTTSDPTLATVSATSNSAATVASAGKRGVVTISAITPLGLTGAAVLTVVPAASRIVVISGGGQAGVAGSPLALPLVVEVQAADNLPVPKALVTFRAMTAGGGVATASATTDANGRASTSLTPGRIAGVYQFEAASDTLMVGTSVTATAAPATEISIVSGNFQAGIIGMTLSQPLVVKVIDKFGLPVAGTTVKWSTASGNGAPANATSTTAADGTASNSYTLGTVVRTEDLRASLPDVSPSSGEVSFALEATALLPEVLLGTGRDQHATVGTNLPYPLLVTVTDRFGNSVPGANVAWSIAATNTAKATLSPASSTTDIRGNASTVVTLGSVAGSLTVTATVGDLALNYSATADPAFSGAGQGTLNGLVFDAVSGGALSGATVAVLSGSQTVATVTTNGNGNFTTARLPAGKYGVMISATGYTSVTIATVTVDGNTQAPAAPLVPQSTQLGSIAGIAFDATNNQPVTPTVTLELRAGVNSSTGTPLRTVTTIQSSSYTFSNVAAGTYSVLAKAPGYADATRTGISVGGSVTSNQNIFISPVGVAGAVRIVLTWRSMPRDLNSYLSGPQGDRGHFLIGNGSRGNCEASPFACLDVDATNGGGPETITIARQRSGTYRYSVNNYSGSPNIDVSGARVDVYIDNALAQSFFVPQGIGSTWTVFDLSGTVITPINSISNNPTLSRLPVGGGVSPARIPTSAAGPSGSHDDVARINEALKSHPKRAAAPR